MGRQFPTENTTVGTQTVVTIIEQTQEQVLLPTAAAAVSAYYCAVFNGPNTVVTADPNTSGLMPAAGIFLANASSGTPVQVVIRGKISAAAYSLMSGNLVFVGSGGLLVASSPQASGLVVQRMGFADSVAGLDLNPAMNYFRVGQ